MTSPSEAATPALKHVRPGLLHVLALAHTLMLRTWARGARDRRKIVRLGVELERCRNELATEREKFRLVSARMARVPAAERPRYTPFERMAILELRAANAWSLADTATVAQVEPETVSSWETRAADGNENLVQLAAPVNRFPDFVAYAVQRLKVHCPLMGRRALARGLAKQGLHLAASTVARLLARDVPPPKTDTSPVEEPAPAAEPARTVVANYPDHVWNVDLTVVPIAGGFWLPWLPFALPQGWPFCWWVLAVVDHYSRAAIGMAVFDSQPTAAQVCRELDGIIRNHGAAPKYVISDKGAQFDCDHYRDWCKGRDKPVKPRFGAVGKYGSIALTERFILSLKTECIVQLLTTPLRIEAMRFELDVYRRWYNEHRPHQALRGATPNERRKGAMPANRRPRLEPRPRWPRGAPCAAPWALVKGKPGARFELHVSFLEGRKHLPVVELRPAA